MRLDCSPGLGITTVLRCSPISSECKHRHLFARFRNTEFLLVCRQLCHIHIHHTRFVDCVVQYQSKCNLFDHKSGCTSIVLYTYMWTMFAYFARMQQVFMIARYHRHRIAAAIFEVTLSAQVTITHQRNPFPLPFEAIPQKLRARSPITSVFQIIASFALLYCPHYMAVLWNSAIARLHDGIVPARYKLPNSMLIAVFTLMHLTVLVNIVIYGLKSKTMRKSIQNYWRKKRTKHEINVEIQARTPSTCGSRRPSLNAINVNRSTSNRRLSETYIQIGCKNGTNRSQMKRIASELSWQPMSSHTDATIVSQLAHSSSINTLQIPSQDADAINGHATDHTAYQHVCQSTKAVQRNVCVHQSKSNLNLAASLLNRVFRLDVNGVYHKCHEQLQSPQILITGAQSDDSVPKIHPLAFKTPNGHQSHDLFASVQRWVDSDDNDECDMTPFASDSFASGSKRCLSLDEQTSYGNEFYGNDIGEPLIFSWPTTRKKYKNLNGYQLKVNPLYADRCEEPEIIL